MRRHAPGVTLSGVHRGAPAHDAAGESERKHSWLRVIAAAP